MSRYYYRGRCYTQKRSLKSKVRQLAERAWEAIQGDHPAGAEALVERLIREYPEHKEPQKPKEPEEHKEPEPQEPKDKGD
jgi:hypothetical protein